MGMSIARREFMDQLVSLLPRQGESKEGKGLSAQELRDKMQHYFPANGNPDAQLRKIQRDLRYLVHTEKRLVVENPDEEAFRYLRAADDENYCVEDWETIQQQIEDHLKYLLPQHRLDRALQRLQFDRSRGRLRDNQFRVVPDTLRLMPAEFKPAILTTLLQALSRGYAVKVSYRSQNGLCDPDTRLHLQAAIQRGPRFYVYALKNDETAPVRMYALHRFISVEMLENELARQDPGFDLDQKINTGQADFTQGQMTDLTIRVRKYVEPLLRECPFTPDQVIEDEPEGSSFVAKISARVPLSGQLFRWLLGCGSNVEVIEPLELRNAIISQAQALVSVYQTPPP